MAPADEDAGPLTVGRHRRGYSAVEYVLTVTLKQTTQGTGHPLVTNIGGTVIVSLFVSPVRRWLEKKIDKLVFGRNR
jgi:hypothetical protein